MPRDEQSKQNLNALLDNYRPLGPHYLLAAALAQRPRDEEKKNDKPSEDKVAA